MIRHTQEKNNKKEICFLFSLTSEESQDSDILWPQHTQPISCES